MPMPSTYREVCPQYRKRDRKLWLKAAAFSHLDASYARFQQVWCRCHQHRVSTIDMGT